MATPKTNSTTVAPTSTPASQGEVDVLRTQVDDLRNLIYVLVALLGGGLVFEFFTWRQSNTRAAEVHRLYVEGEAIGQARGAAYEQRAAEAHALFVARETATQEYAEGIHESAQKTVQLVNETLGLAKEASQQAATAMRAKVRQNLAAIEDRAEDDLRIALMPSTSLRLIVEDPTVRGAVVDIAEDLASLSSHLEIQEIELSPISVFVKGMDRQFRTEPTPAIDNFRDAARLSVQRGETDLASLSFYWEGYVENNLGHYAVARDLFDRALSYVGPDTSRFVELQRIKRESRFFELASRQRLIERVSLQAGELVPDRWSAISAFIDEFREFSEAIPDADEYVTAKTRVIQTLANMLTWTARQSSEPEARLREALEGFEVAARGKREADIDLWAHFGIAESKFALADSDSSDLARSYQLILDKADKQLRVRSEPRSAVSLVETRLIALARMSSLTGRELTADMNGALHEISRTLNDVPQAMVMFSQLEKCNLPWLEFSQEVDDFYVQHRDSFTTVGNGQEMPDDLRRVLPRD